jgi:hypothetical protein
VTAGPTAADVTAVIDDARAFGFSQAQIDQLLASVPGSPASEAFKVHPANIFALRLMLDVQTQWREQALSTWNKATVVKAGLPYQHLAEIARLSGLGEISPANFRRIQHFEAQALKAWGEARQ